MLPVEEFEPSPADAAGRQQWRRLAAEIRAEAAGLPEPLAHWRMDEKVLDAMSRVPRERFMHESQQGVAYANHPAPIGYGQTISQPFIVALMTDLLRVDKTARVLEVGTGSGYQAAVLAELVARVYSTEIVAPLAAEARERLHSLGYNNVEVQASDGSVGWKEHAPFDGIIVTAAAPFVPPGLIAQLAPRSRMVIPVRGSCGLEWLTVVERSEAGAAHERALLPVSFVPLTSEPLPQGPGW